MKAHIQVKEDGLYYIAYWPESLFNEPHKPITRTGEDYETAREKALLSSVKIHADSTDLLYSMLPERVCFAGQAIGEVFEIDFDGEIILKNTGNTFNVKTDEQLAYFIPSLNKDLSNSKEGGEVGIEDWKTCTECGAINHLDNQKCDECEWGKNFKYNKCPGEQDAEDKDLSLFEKIKSVLVSYKCQYSHDEDGDNMQLVDLISPKEDNDIARGINELEHLAEDILEVISPPTDRQEELRNDLIDFLDRVMFPSYHTDGFSAYSKADDLIELLSEYFPNITRKVNN